MADDFYPRRPMSFFVRRMVSYLHGCGRWGSEWGGGGWQGSERRWDRLNGGPIVLEGLLEGNVSTLPRRSQRQDADPRSAVLHGTDRDRCH